MGSNRGRPQGYKCLTPGEILKQRMAKQNGSVAERAKRLEDFGRRHRLSLNGLKIKDLINEGSVCP